MPRLTDQHYVETQHWLAHTWRVHMSTFGLVSPREQWLIHDFFVPSWSLTDDELLAHRAKVTAERPNLPAAAGRAAARLNARLEAIQSAPASVSAAGKRQVRVYAVVRPAVDTDALARALLRAAEALGTNRPAA